LKVTTLAPASFSELLYAFDDHHPHLAEGQHHPSPRGLSATTSFRRVVKPVCACQ
jgi:hypothetical protein